MTDLKLFNQLSSLPKELKKEVQDFIESLKAKARVTKKIQQRQFGAAKGFFVMHEDFDEPLEDFKDYTYGPAFVSIDPALNEYCEKITFPEKLEQANKVLKMAKLPPNKNRY